MNFYDLPLDMQEEILKLASEHTVTIDEATKYYLMGGEHADDLCALRDAGANDYMIEFFNYSMWNEKNKYLFEEMKKLSKSKLQIAWEKFIITFAESVGIIKILDWLNKKLSKQ